MLVHTDKACETGGMSPTPTPPVVPSALNRLMTAVQWVENGQLRGFTNVSLARECAKLLASPISHSHIAKIRQGAQRDPRASLIWAMSVAFSQRAVVPITADYFLGGRTRAQVDRELDLHLEQLTSEIARAEGGERPAPR